MCADLDSSHSYSVVDVIIPAYNEEQSIPLVIGDIPTFVRDIVVADNNSRDRTAEVASTAGATVVPAPIQGYGSACLAGLAYVAQKEIHPDIIVFLDADYSDHPQEMEQLIQPIIEGTADMVIGSRALGDKEAGSMMPAQIFGNWLATRMMRLFYGLRYTDLGPFRAIRYDALCALDMCDPNYGWTIEMQIKAHKKGLSFAEVPVSYRCRIGTSKVSGTIKGTIMAGYKIILTIFRYL